MVELFQLRCFVAVAEELHFGRAAVRMNMTQPPLSRQIQLLERQLDVVLVARSTRSVRLTPAGKSFLADARQILRLVESAALMSRRVANGEVGSLTLGFTAASGYSYVPRMIGRLRAVLPSVDLVLKEMVSVDQLEALLTRRIDLGLLRPPIVHAELASMPVLRERLLIAAPRDGLDGRPTPTRLADFEDLPTVMFAPEGARYFYDLLTGLFTGAGVTPRTVQFVSQIHSILALVDAGVGAALVPEAAQALRFAGVAFTPLEEAGQPVELMLAWHRDSDNPALARATAHLGES